VGASVAAVTVTGPGLAGFVASALMGTSGCVDRRTGRPMADAAQGMATDPPSGPVLDATEPGTSD
jgi:hypothetical protein